MDTILKMSRDTVKAFVFEAKRQDSWLSVLSDDAMIAETACGTALWNKPAAISNLCEQAGYFISNFIPVNNWPSGQGDTGDQEGLSVCRNMKSTKNLCQPVTI